MITAAVIAAVLIHYDIHELTITGNISAGLPPFRVPSFSLDYGNGTGRVHKNFGDIISVSTLCSYIIHIFKKATLWFYNESTCSDQLVHTYCNEIIT